MPPFRILPPAVYPAVLVGLMLAWTPGFSPLGAQQAAAKPAAPPAAPVSSVRVTVIVHDEKGDPVQGAGVVLHQVSMDKGRMPKDPFNVELHTDNTGTITVQGFAPGVVLVQVIAKGYNTWGVPYIMRDADETVHVQLSPPQRQYSIYQ